MSKQGSLDEVCLAIGDVTLVWDDGKQVKAHEFCRGSPDSVRELNVEYTVG